MPKRTESKPQKPARKPAIRRRKPAIGHEQIAERAYYLSLAGGADPLVNWLQAERELTVG
jgi:hypothetical protein